jgi:ABC-type multidrug transport system fused ATPase/permease subunit
MITYQQIKKGFNVLISAFTPYKVLFFLVLLVDGVKVILEVLLPILFLPVFDNLLGTQDETVNLLGGLDSIMSWMKTSFGFSAITVSLLLLLSVSFSKCIFGVLFSYLNLKLSYSYARDMRDIIFQDLLKTKWLYQLEKRVGDSIDIIVNQVERSRVCLTDTMAFFDLAGMAILYTIGAAYIFGKSNSMSYITILVAGGAVVLIGAVILPIAFVSRYYGKKLIQVTHDLTNHMEESLSGFKIVKACRMEKSAGKFVAGKTEIWRRYCMIVDLMKNVPTHVLEFIVIFGLACFLVLMNKYQLVGLSGAAVTGMLLYRCFTRISTLQTFWVRIFQNISCINYVQDFHAELLKNTEQSTGKTINSFEKIEFKNFDFQYVSDQHALQDLSLDINCGETIGIVGGSGAGKTTFVDVMLSFLPPTSGQVLVNGISMQDMNPQKWRDLIGYVPQEAVMFNESVRYNITLGRTDISEDEIRRAAKMANADDFIEQLSDGYETVIGKRGSKISGGQRQRLAMVRALVRKPQILILDEVTSAVDAHTEKRMQDALNRLKGEMTIIVVAHRLATVMKSDRILVLDKGLLAENGTPAELLKKKGMFSELVSLQNLT